jgi:hypothetical protein
MPSALADRGQLVAGREGDDQRGMRGMYRRGSIPFSNGNSTVPAIATHCSLGTATMRPSVFRQLPNPS